MLDQLAQWLAEHPAIKTALIVGVVVSFGEFVRRMRERDMEKLRRFREDADRRAGERTAAIAERVSKLGSASGSTQQRIPD